MPPDSTPPSAAGLATDEMVLRAHTAWIIALSKMSEEVFVEMTTGQAQTALRAALNASLRCQFPDTRVEGDERLDRAIDALHDVWFSDHGDFNKVQRIVAEMLRSIPTPSVEVMATALRQIADSDGEHAPRFRQIARHALSTVSEPQGQTGGERG